jgi:hypothetical protein
VETYYSQCVQTFPRNLKNRVQSSVRILEIIEIQCSEDGECYAQKLKAFLGLVDDGALSATHPVSEIVVGTVLNHTRGCESIDLHHLTSAHVGLRNCSKDDVPDWLRYVSLNNPRGIGHFYRAHIHGHSLRAGN